MDFRLFALLTGKKLFEIFTRGTKWLATLWTMLAEKRPRGKLTVYHDLPEGQYIRLIELRPKDATRVTCALRTVKLSAAPEYEALSYCWGSDSLLSVVSIVSPECDEDPQTIGSVAVTENLYNALSTLAPSHGIRQVWADALSINQINTDERNHQVAFMKHIYTRARRTIVWLGEVKETTDVALQVIDDIWQETTKLVDISELKRHIHLPMVPPGSLPELPALHLREQHVEAVCDLLNAPWFSRIWVIQEISFAREIVVLIGRREIVWDKLGLAACRISQLLGTVGLPGAANFSGFPINPPGNAAYLWVDVFSNNDSAISPLGVAVSSWKTSEPRDVIYALLGFDAVSRSIPIVPDYHRPLKDVFIDVFRAYTEQTGLLRMLELVNHVPITRHSTAEPVEVQDAFPSWLPAFNKQRHSMNARYTRCVNPWIVTNMCKASYDIRAVGASHMLSCRGAVVDEIASCSASGGSWRAADEMLKRCLVNILDFWVSTDPGRTGCTSHAPAFTIALASAITGGCGTNNSPVSETVESAEFHLQVFKAAMALLWTRYHARLSVPQQDRFSRFSDVFSAESDPALQKSARILLLLLEFCLTHRRLFLTRKGYIGVGPSNLAPGDAVMMLFGSIRLCIGRKVPGQGYHQYVGIAAAHGLMEDELQAWREVRLKPEQIRFM